MRLLEQNKICLFPHIGAFQVDLEMPCSFKRFANMKLFATHFGIILNNDGQYYHLINQDWDLLVNRTDLYQYLLQMTQQLPAHPALPQLLEGQLKPPIQSQEIWAAGVTYKRSMEARMKEAEEAGGGDFYDRVYDAPRPELFFKSTAARTVGHTGTVFIRKDSSWNVPEPELTLFINYKEEIVGYTIGNDMSSRSIEGENPLYLPQAKTYERSASIGPCLYIPPTPISPETTIRMTIWRNQEKQYDDAVQINQMKRTHAELVDYLTRACQFRFGCYLMTGTCLVPPDHFTLQPNDRIEISIDGIGTLENFVAYLEK